LGSPLAPLPVLVPLAGAIFLALVNKHSARWFADLVSISAVSASGIISLVLLHRTASVPIVYWFGGWTPRGGIAVGINFYIDPISAGLAAFICLLALCSFIFSLHYFDSVGNLYHVLMLGFVAGMCGFSCSGDLFNLFVFFELMSISAFALCGYKTEEPSTQQGAINFAVMNTIGGFLALLGIAMLYARTGALNLAQIGRALSHQADILFVTAFVFVICGFLVKAAVFPFHFWLADAHAVAPTPVCVLFSGIMVQLAVYAVARVYWSAMEGPMSGHQAAITSVLAIAGTITALLGAIMCFAQQHIKRMLAFSTISHTGILVVAFALLKPKALAGAALYVIGHGAAKGALFLVAGILLHRFGSVDESSLYGRGRSMKWTGAVFAFSGLGLAGLIPFGTFAGEHGMDAAAEGTSFWWVKVVFIIAATLTAAAVFRVYARVFLGRGVPNAAEELAKTSDEARETKGPHDHVPAVMFIPAAILALAAISSGCVPGSVAHFRRSASVFSETAAYQAQVLDGTALQEPMLSKAGEQPFPAAIRSAVTTMLAVAVAILALLPHRHRKLLHVERLSRTFLAVRNAHSGKIGDYVVYFSFGVTAIGTVLVFLICRH